MKIGILCHASLGGSARVATGLATALARRGHRVHLFSRTIPFGRPASLHGVQQHTIVPEQSNGRHPSQLYTEWPVEELQTLQARVRQVVEDEGLDVLHIHYAAPFATIATALKNSLGAAAPSTVVTLHGSDVTVCGRDPVRGPALAAAIRAMDVVTTVSHAHARLAAEVFKLPELPLVIPNFIELTQFKQPPPPASAQVTSANGVGSKARIVHVSNFRRVKDLSSVVRIFTGIRRQMPAALWLIGDGQEMAAARALLRENGLESEVCYWGIQYDVAPLVAQADLMLIASRYESFCLSALEAMACGVPVVATRVGGLPEVVVDGECGFLFPSGDEDAAVNCAFRLLSDPVRHAAMRRAAVQHARSFRSEHIVPRYERLYAQQCQGHNNRKAL